MQQNQIQRLGLRKKETQEMVQKNFDRYKQDESGKWHCAVCRVVKLDIAFAGHDTPATRAPQAGQNTPVAQ